MLDPEIPTSDELNPYKCLDGNHAEKNWRGLDVIKGCEMLTERSGAYWEDFSYMGIRAYEYYVHSIVGYMESCHSIDSDDINSIINIIKSWQDSKIGKDTHAAHLKILMKIVSNYEKYDIDASIYGDLRRLSMNLINKCKTL